MGRMEPNAPKRQKRHNTLEMALLAGFKAALVIILWRNRKLLSD